MRYSYKKKHGIQEISPSIFDFVESHIYKNNIFQNVSIYFLICFELLWYNKMNKYGALGPHKSRNHEKSRF